MFQLTPTGQLLARQVLNWSLAPEPIQQERREAWAHRSGEKPESVRPECPVCSQRFCALYVFVVLLERLSAGLAEPWETLEQQLVTRALAQASTPALERLCLQSETFPFSQWPVSVREKLAPLLASMGWNPLPIAAESRALVPTLPDLKWPCERISRLRLDYGLMSGPARLYLQALMSPELYPRSALALQQARGIPQTAFIRLLRPLFQQDQALVLWLENAMPAGVVFIKKSAWEIQQVFRG